MAEGAERPATDSIGIGLLGLGVVGSGVVQALIAHAESYARSAGRPLQLRRVLVRDLNKSRSVGLAPDLLTTDPRLVVDDPHIQIIVELMGGEEPAFDLIQRALRRGCHVVTANKEVIAKHGPELFALAQQHGVDILFEASAGGGIPLIAPLKRDLLANEISSLRAIVNGTTNYILTRMTHEGLDFAEALAGAQRLGYAEADPTNDVEGIDAAYKLAILASLAFHVTVHPSDIYREGITRLTANDFRYAHELGYTIKLLALARRFTDETLQARVHPALLREEEPLAKVDGVVNAVEIEGNLLGVVLFQGRGAGALPTASAVIADLLDVAQRISLGASGARGVPPSPRCAVRPIAELASRYYLRLRVPDRAGVLSRVCSVLGDDHQISISDIIQKEKRQADQTSEIVIMTHVARESAMQAALTELERLPVVQAVGNFIRVDSDDS